MSGFSHNRLFRRNHNLNFASPDQRRSLSPYRAVRGGATSAASYDSNAETETRFKPVRDKDASPGTRSSNYGGPRDEEEVDLRKKFFKITID